MSLLERWITWVEPFGPNNEPVYMFVPESTAIAVSKDFAKRSNHTYTSDEEALSNFMDVHWAWFTEKPKGIK